MLREVEGVVTTETFPYLQPREAGLRLGHCTSWTEGRVTTRRPHRERDEAVRGRDRGRRPVARDRGGKFYALLGPSGCGKTTTLRMIGGFEEPTEGTIYLGDRAVTGLPPHKRDVNTVFQSYALFPHLTIFENVAFGLRRKGVKKGDELKGRSTRCCASSASPATAAASRGSSPGGQQQRVALARALVNVPRVLLLDEPLGALDLKLRKEMQLELKSIQHDIGITFVHVTHDQEEAMTMADCIVVMNGGRIEQLGDAGRAVRASERRRSSPTSSASRTCSPAPSRASTACGSAAATLLHVAPVR